jgi:hypothetical protein
MADASPCVIFMHVPKTAGTTLHQIMARQYAPEATYVIDGRRVDDSVSELRNLPDDQRQRLRCIRGHMRFGLHTLTDRPTTYVAMLRNPVDRLVSLYRYVCRTKQHYMHEEVTKRGLSLRAFVESELSEVLENGQTRPLAGAERGHTPPNMLALAKAHVAEHFAVVGLTERFDESLLLMKDELGWADVSYERRNTASRPTSSDELDPETRQVILQRNDLDAELYA